MQPIVFDAGLRAPDGRDGRSEPATAGSAPRRVGGAGRPLVAVRHHRPDVYELTVSPGAGVRELVGVTSTLPGVVYADHRRVASADPAAVLTFRAMPAEPDGMATPPSARAGRAGWRPTVEPAAAVPLTAYEHALRKILSTEAYRRHGRQLVYGLVHCDPDLVIAFADEIHAAWSPPT